MDTAAFELVSNSPRWFSVDEAIPLPIAGTTTIYKAIMLNYQESLLSDVISYNQHSCFKTVLILF